MEPDEVSLHSGAEAEPVHTAGLSRRALLQRAASSAVGLVAIAATRSESASAHAWPGASAYDAEVPTAWFDLALGLVRTTQGFSPPVVSRAFGYAGVALYEAVAPGITKRGSFVGVLNGLTRAPGAADSAYRPRAFTVIQRLVGSLAHELPGHPQVRESAAGRGGQLEPGAAVGAPLLRNSAATFEH
jgi:hypothetical protein